MSTIPAQNPDTDLRSKATEVAIRLVVVALLIYWCYAIFRPFLMPLVWGIVLAVALRPAYLPIERLCRGRRKLAGTVFVLITLGLLLVPTVLLSESVVDGVRFVKAAIEDGRVKVPPPPQRIADWPVVGTSIYDAWNLAATNLDAVAAKFHTQITAFGGWLIATAKQAAGAAILTAVALVIAAALLVKREPAVAAARALGARLGGARGVEFVGLAGSAIATVAKGVVGVAAIQAALAAVGMLLAGVPGAGLWAILVLIVAVAQLPPLLILAPAIVYVIAKNDSTLTIVLFSVWSVVVSFSDAILKPLLMGRGTGIPVGVILIGAIGGLVLHGLIGLFVGAVVFSIGYRVVVGWAEQAPGVTAPEPGASSDRG